MDADGDRIGCRGLALTGTDADDRTGALASGIGIQRRSIGSGRGRGTGRRRGGRGTGRGGIGSFLVAQSFVVRIGSVAAFRCAFVFGRFLMRCAAAVRIQQHRSGSGQSQAVGSVHVHLNARTQRPLVHGRRDRTPLRPSRLQRHRRSAFRTDSGHFFFVFFWFGFLDFFWMQMRMKQQAEVGEGQNIEKKNKKYEQ